MELQKIEQLLNKYFEGETTLKEEKVLRDYFNSTEVAPHLQVYQSMFAHFSASKNEVHQNEVKAFSKKPMQAENRSLWYSIAAGLAIVLGATFFFQQQNNTVPQEQEVLMAYEQTKNALQMVSEILNESTSQLTYINEFETTKNKIFK
ncbi:MAG TPA: hypothetical protein VFD80_09140 [Flavobacteriaceae bacterium]|nr:hypothetical protein [Flavobacteriaceae bacterium]